MMHCSKPKLGQFMHINYLTLSSYQLCQKKKKKSLLNIKMYKNNYKEKTLNLSSIKILKKIIILIPFGNFYTWKKLVTKIYAYCSTEIILSCIWTTMDDRYEIAC